LTTQIAGSSSAKTFTVQGGQAPALLVDMDAALSDDNNSGGVVDSLKLARHDYQIPPDYTVNTTTSGTDITLTSGNVVFIEETGVLTGGGAPFDGAGYYTYTGASTLTGVNTALNYSGGIASGFSFATQFNFTQYGVTVAFYHTRGTTNPIPASGDYELVLYKHLPSGTAQLDLSDEIPQLSAPVPAAGDTSDLSNGAPLRARGIYLEKGDRLYAAIFPNTTYPSGYTPGLSVVAQGGFF
jgi:hypothetical protein